MCQSHPIYISEGADLEPKPKECAMINEYTNYFSFVKSPDKNSIFSNPDVEHLVNTISGNEKMKKFSFANKEEEKIAKTYMRMFFSLTIIRLCRGETLGVARQKSLEQMNNYLKTKENAPDSVSKYLLKFKEEFHQEIAKINMNDKDNAQKKLKIDATLAKQLEQTFAREFKNGLKVLDNMSQQKVMEDTLGKETLEKQNENQQKSKSFEQGKQNAQQLIKQLLVQQIMNQRAA